MYHPNPCALLRLNRTCTVRQCATRTSQYLHSGVYRTHLGRAALRGMVASSLLHSPKIPETEKHFPIGETVKSAPLATFNEQMLIPDLLKAAPQARVVLDRYGLRGCGGPLGPVETLGFFAKAHDVPLPR